MQISYQFKYDREIQTPPSYSESTCEMGFKIPIMSNKK